MNEECVIHVQIGPTVVTNVNPTIQWERIPFPEGIWFEVEAVAMGLHVSKKRIYNLLSEHRAMFRRRKHRRKRLLSAEDVQFLRQFIPVKQEIISHK